jgi:hypothetical protein
MAQDVRTRINQLSRDRIQEIFEAYGYAVYDSESTEQLREALQIDVEDGTIPDSELDT